jgi:L-threonylcarbamoyladenylate synthase
MPILDGTTPAALQPRPNCWPPASWWPSHRNRLRPGRPRRRRRAVARIFAAKGRPADHPLIVHVADAARQAFADLPARPRPALMAAVLARAADPDRAAARGRGQRGGRRAGQHRPAHAGAPGGAGPAAACRAPGRAGRGRAQRQPLRPRQPHHGGPCGREFGDALLVLDGGACPVGIESAIVDCTRGSPRCCARARARWPRTTRPCHLLLLDTPALRSRLAAPPPGSKQGVAVYSRLAPAAGHGWIWRQMPSQAAAAAHELFAVLRELDAAGVGTIWVEQPPPDPAWDGVRDRLQRAAA